ncbi:MAG: L-seryl-tRNA(Sec) selenium transferase, partial [Planctomycetota bacterium]|jgi:L-seryl-tRNA(Ser) seleniumtransferase
MNPAPANDDGDSRRKLIPVYTLLEDKRVLAMIEEFSRPVVLEAVKEAADSIRREVGSEGTPPGIDEAVARVRSLVDRHEGERLRPVINATGIILHTGLGRAVLPKSVVDALHKLDRCCNTQVDLDTGKRGARNHMTEYLLTKLTGAEAALVVNNNAAATYLILAVLCEGTEVLVSIGQLIEIGGSFRLPDCIRQSGAELVLVGTTNRTHLRDYEQALSERTGAIFRANPSNYRVMGFTKEVLVDMKRFNLPEEGTVQESITAGADLACFSGDKLIGGPQAGIIVGRSELIAKIKKHPLTRMMRVCKLTDLALEQTLRLFLDEEALVENSPTLGMLAAPAATLEARASRLKSRIDAGNLPLTTEVRQDESAAGGGAMPVTPIATFVLAISSPAHSPDRLSQLLRKNEPPIITRISEGDIIIDMRTLLDGDDEEIHEALRRIARADA